MHENILIPMLIMSAIGQYNKLRFHEDKLYLIYIKSCKCWRLSNKYLLFVQFWCEYIRVYFFCRLIFINSNNYFVPITKNKWCCNKFLQISPIWKIRLLNSTNTIIYDIYTVHDSGSKLKLNEKSWICIPEKLKRLV